MTIKEHIFSRNRLLCPSPDLKKSAAWPWLKKGWLRLREWFQAPQGSPMPVWKKAPPRLYQLEPRLLFDGSLGAVAAEAVTLLTEVAGTVEPAFQADAAAVTEKNVAVIDTSISNYEDLEITAQAAGMDVILISAQENGFETLAQLLEGRRDIGALHILSHGSPSKVFLGADTLSSETMAQHTASLLTISQSLSPDGDILLYGCRVGDTSQGIEFVRELSILTQADIAASNDPTGNAEKGGDWELEIRTGDIEAPMPFTDKALKDFSDILSYSGTINFSNVDYVGGSYYGPANAHLDARVNVGSYVLIADGTSVRTRADGSVLRSGIYNGVHETQLTLRFSNGEIFDVQTLYLYHRSNDPIYGQFRDFIITSDQGHSHTINNLDNVTGQNPILNFTNITELRITVAEPSGFEMFIDNMVVNNLRPANTAPTLTTPPTDITVLEDTFSHVNLSTVALADAENDPLTLTLRAGSGTFAAPADGAAIGSGVTETWVNATTITLNGTAADINTYLDTASHIQYKGPQDAAGDNAATITLSASDGTATLVSDPVVNVDITAVNDSPVVTGAPASITLARTATSAVDLSDITLSDVDSSDPDFTLTLTTAQGSLSATSAGGVGISGSGSSSITLTGSVSQINTYLNAADQIQYTGMNDTQLSLTANDGDGSGNLVLGTIALSRPTMAQHIPIVEERPVTHRPPAPPIQLETPTMAVAPPSDESESRPPPPLPISDGGEDTPEPDSPPEGTSFLNQYIRVWVDSQGQIQFSQDAPQTAVDNDIEITSVDIHPLTRALTLVLQAQDPAVQNNLQVTLPDGSPLPDWFSYASESGTVSGTPPEDIQTLIFQVRQMDSQGSTQTLELEIVFPAPPI